MSIVAQLGFPVDPGAPGVHELGTIEECRPERCPWCGAPGRDESDRLTMQSHGRYRRQALGQPGGRGMLVWIRRFLCRLCGHTQSILPQWLHPWRWYRGDRIVEVLFRSEIRGEPIEQLQQEVTGTGGGRREKGWRTLTRWKQDLLNKPSLFGWLGSRASEALGVGARLGVLLFGQQPGGSPALEQWTVEAVSNAATAALAGTCHLRGAQAT